MTVAACPSCRDRKLAGEQGGNAWGGPPITSRRASYRFLARFCNVAGAYNLPHCRSPLGCGN